MPAIKLDRFSGMVPAVDDRILPPVVASFARNAWLYSGAITGFHTPQNIHTCASPSIGSVYRIPRSYLDADHIRDAAWMEFINPFTDVLRAAVVGDTYERIYWVSPTTQASYAPKANILAGGATYLLGVPAPAAAPNVNAIAGSVGIAAGVATVNGVIGGSAALGVGEAIGAASGSSTARGVSSIAASIGLTYTRSYVVTYVSAYGEEGPPSLPSTVTGPVLGTWTIGLTPLVDAQRNITKTRIYRTITSSSGVATYFMVAELPIATTTYTDTLKDSEIASNQQLQSTTWYPPPSDLQGWVSMPNGIIAGWRGKEIWFCEPYRPHAWPPQYALSTEYDIVGLGVYGQTLIVCTQGYPAAVTGINPANMTMAKVSTFEPCQSRGSIVASPEGVYYASPNGLILAAQGAFTNVTREFITKDKWQTFTKIATLRAARLGTAYYAYGSTRAGCFDAAAFSTDAFEQEDFTASYAGFFIDPANAGVISTLYSDTPTTNVLQDGWSGEIFILREGNVYWLNMADESLDKDVVTWRSKVFQSNMKDNFQAAKVYFTIPPGCTAHPTGPRNNALVQVIDTNQYGLLRVYADNRLVATRELRESGELLRLPSGFKAEFWQIEFQARVNINSIQMATSSKELRQT